MGHLINPAALRMGWSSNWVDFFFVDQKYYPQYLHMLFRLRLVMTVIFKGFWFERKAGFFYSHFLLAKDYTELSLKIYFYDGKTEGFFFTMEDYVREDRDYLYENLDYKTYHTKKSDTFFSFYIYFIFFRLFNTFYIKAEWSYALSQHYAIEKIAEAFFTFDSKLMRSALQIKPSNRIWDPQSSEERPTFISIARCRTTSIRFFWFYLLCKDLAMIQDVNDVKDALSNYDYVQKLSFIYTMLVRNIAFFKCIRLYVIYLMNYLALDHTSDGFPLDIVHLHFMVITNENVTAGFIARYIALKLEQGFTTRSLLNPLRREFKRLLNIDSLRQREVNSSFDYLLRKYSNRNYFSSLFRTIIRTLALSYQKYNSVHLFRCKNYVSFDGFIFLNSIFKKWNYKSDEGHKKLFSLCNKYVRYYFFFALFNYNKVDTYYTSIVNHLFKIPPEIKFHTQFNNKISLVDFPSIVPKLIFNTFENHSHWVGKPFALYSYPLLLVFLTSFNKKMHAFYSHQSYHYLGKAVLAKNRLLRLHNPSTNDDVHLGFRGFKVQCLGRFTRRQRSAKLTWGQGGMPLNTISAFIDYGTFTVVLKNSLINVKVWFYKDKGFSEYFLKLL